MSILGLGMMEMMSVQNKTSKTGEIALETNEMFGKVQRYMNRSEICTETLKNIFIAENTSKTFSLIKSPTQNLLSTEIAGGIGTENLPITVESMTVTRGTGSQKNEISLMIEFKKKRRDNSFGSETFKRSLTLEAKFENATSNKIIGCYSTTDAVVDKARETMCRDLGSAKWDESKCFPRKMIKYSVYPLVKKVNNNGAGHAGQCPEGYFMTGLRVGGETQTLSCSRLANNNFSLENPIASFSNVADGGGGFELNCPSQQFITGLSLLSGIFKLDCSRYDNGGLLQMVATGPVQGRFNDGRAGWNDKCPGGYFVTGYSVMAEQMKLYCEKFEF